MTARWWAGVPGPGVVPDAHLLEAVDRALTPAGVVAELVCTSVDRAAASPRTAVALRLSGEPADRARALIALARALDGPVLTGDADRGPDAALAALRAATTGVAGRCVRFPGQDAVRGRLPVADLIAGTAIDQLVGVGVAVAPDAVVDTRDFLRPQFSGGRLTLVVEQGPDGVLQPFEVEFPHECCGGHRS